MHWVVLGDFNEVICQSEKWGGDPINSHRTNHFNHTINICNLLDLGFNGPKFTWTNRRKINPIDKRLDRAFGNDEWVTKFLNSSIWHLARISSDHASILRTFHNLPPLVGAKPFRFCLCAFKIRPLRELCKRRGDERDLITLA